MNRKQIANIYKALEGRKDRSAWSKGVTVYAFELLGNLTEWIVDGWVNEDKITNTQELENILLNGADSWKTYSYGGCALIYDYQIAKRLCNPTELKKTADGFKDPNKSETWLDVQARALFQAYHIIKGLYINELNK